MTDWSRVSRRIARRFGIDPVLFDRQMEHESAGYAPDVISGARNSPAGAQGIAQIMPDTADAWGVNPLRPRKALRAAAQHMRDYVQQFGSYEDALRAYNAGPGAVEASKGYDETNNYVNLIMGNRTPQPLGKPQQAGSGNRNHNRSEGTLGTPTTFSYENNIDPMSIISALGKQTAPDSGEQSDLDKMIQTNFQLLAQLANPGTLTTTPGTPGTPGKGGGVNGGLYAGVENMPGLKGIVRRAKKINREKQPYLWGGGHNTNGKIGGEPLDCSGAVSDVLGVDPRVSGAFESWGEPGEGKHVTIYANDTHVLMKINGRFWGTSNANPGGGAGWIPASHISASYLSGFTKRHPKGL